jgi:hypothetical protein
VYMEITYLAYVVGSVAATVWIARTLRRGGGAFLAERFADRPEMADSLSHLLAVGFYLVHVGFAMLALRFGGRATDWPTAIEVWSTKIGWVLFLLAISTYLHLRIYTSLRRGPPTSEWNATPIPAELATETR